MNEKTVLLLGGSFNPIHASHFQVLMNVFKMLNQGEIVVDEAWLLPSAQNPFKPKEGMADFHHRLKMCKLQAEGYENWLKVCDFEGKIPPPYDTYTVLTKLQREYPKHQFIWMMGSDNLIHFHTWENWQDILENFAVVAVNRECSKHLVDVCETVHEYASFIYNEDSPFLDLPNIRFVDAGQNVGRATKIREAIGSGKPTEDVRKSVLSYIQQHNLYRS